MEETEDYNLGRPLICDILVVFFTSCELWGPTWAVGIYNIGPPAGEFCKTHSTKYHELGGAPECAIPHK